MTAPVDHPQDTAILTGAERYVDDLAAGRDGPTAHVVFVRSTMAHARILQVATGAAAACPGVLAVVTERELGLMDLSSGPPLPAGLVRPVLARERVRFVGEPIAAVVAATREQAIDAATLVHVEFGAMAVVATPEAAVFDDEVLFPDIETNTVLAVGTGPLPDDLTADVHVSVEVRVPRVLGAPIEPRGASAEWGRDGRLTMTVACQGPHYLRDRLAALYSLRAGDVRVVTPAVGGSFGAKAALVPEILMLPRLATLVGTSVRWSETRQEHALSSHSRAAVLSAALGAGADGRFASLEVHLLQDAGAYPSTGALQPIWAAHVFSGPYRFAAAEFSGGVVVTNLAPVVSVRGSGRVEATLARERAIDELAASVGIDPAELRRANLLPPTSLPYAAPGSGLYDSGDYGEALDRVLARSGYADLRAEQARRRAAGGARGARGARGAGGAAAAGGARGARGAADRMLGIGVTCHVDVSGLAERSEHAAITLEADGSFTVRSGSTPSGQEHHRVWASIAARVLGVGVERVTVHTGDTDDVASGGQTTGSRSAQIGGSAVHRAATQLVGLAGGAPVDWVAVASARADGRDDPLVAVDDFRMEGYTYPYGATVVAVEVDAGTGLVDVRSVTAVIDAGTLLDPDVARGQVHGGLAMGIGQVLGEAIPHDGFGQPLLGPYGAYPIDRWSELPAFDVELMETPSPANPLGAKGVGEVAIVGAVPAVVNAVIDALRPSGVTHLDPPLAPLRVWRALRGG